MANGYALGIDFGTTKSHLAFISRTIEGQTPPHLATYTDESGLPPTSIDVPFSQQGAGVLCEPIPTFIAIDKLSRDLDYPRLIPGFRAINPQQPDVQNYELIADLKERVRCSEDARRTISMDGHTYPVEGLVAHFLWSLRKSAKELLNQPIDDQGITITVPAKSGIVQRMTMQFSAAVAGFRGKIEIVEEPVAAFLYHSHLRPDYFQTRRGKPRYALVVDFGGGTCDIAVIEFLTGRLPRVIGRAMGRFGGGTIDKMFLKKFWIEPKDGEGIPMSWAGFMQADEMTRTILLAHARKAKELLSQISSYAADISGSIPTSAGTTITPRVHQNDLQCMLEDELLETEYADSSEKQNKSLKEHMLKLIDMALLDAKIRRSNIGKLILAGGSVKLHGVRDWVWDFLTTDQGRGQPNEQLEEDDIYDQHSDMCVAGGAAIHQLYRHHRNPKWHGAVIPTLSSKFWLISYRGATSTDDVDKIELGSQHDELPIDCTTYWKAKIIYPVRYSSDGEIVLEIGQGEDSSGAISNWRKSYTLPPEFGTHGTVNKWLKVILVRYYIDEFGILKKISWTPGSLLGGWKQRKTLREFMVLKENELEIGLQSLRLDNKSRIDVLYKQFILGS